MQEAATGPLSHGWSLASAAKRLSLGVAAATVIAMIGGVALASLAKAADDQIIVGLITKTEVNPYFVKLRQSATEEADKLGVEADRPVRQIRRRQRGASRGDRGLHQRRREGHSDHAQ